MGAALANSGRDIVYSCSWPAYIGSNESEKPFSTFIADGCNLWRNWDDIQCNWNSLSSIIDDWGDWGPVLTTYAGPGHWNDPDMLLIGNDCITDAEARTQMAIWSIIAAPLIMGNDVRNLTASTLAILSNEHAIAVNQDVLGKQGLRLTASNVSEQVWARPLHDGSVAVGLYNKADTTRPYPTTCPGDWNMTTDGYIEACGGPGGDENVFNGLSVAQAKEKCCADSKCAGFSFKESDGSGYFKLNADCGFVKDSGYSGYDKIVPPGPSPPPTVPISFNFMDVGLEGLIDVFDIWAQKSLGTFNSSYTASVDAHDTVFLRLSQHRD